MKLENIGYRTENAYGSGERLAKNVISYEIVELGNTDILDYCQQHYGLSELLNSKIDSLINQIETESIDYDDVNAVVTDMLSEISRLTHTEVKYVLWLTDKDSVMKLYAEEGDEEYVTMYHTSRIILSDLGEDGVLYGYQTKPEPIKTLKQKYGGRYIDEKHILHYNEFFNEKP